MSTDLIAPLLNFAGTAGVAILAASLGWWAKESDWKRDIYRQKVATRQRLYADFLAETDRLTLNSVAEKSNKVGEFHPMTRFFSEIELLSTAPVANAAKAICANVLESHSEIPESTANYAELKATFIAAARKEIGEYESNRCVEIYPLPALSMQVIAEHLDAHVGFDQAIAPRRTTLLGRSDEGARTTPHWSRDQFFERDQGWDENTTRSCQFLTPIIKSSAFSNDLSFSFVDYSSNRSERTRRDRTQEVDIQAGCNDQ